MKTWQLVLVQVWVLCFVPVWAFALVFAPLALAPPNPAWSVFLLLVAPPIVALLASIALWIAHCKRNGRWRKMMIITLIVMPNVFVPPLLLFE